MPCSAIQKTVLGAAAFALLALTGAGCAAATDDAASGEENVTGSGKMQLLVTVDWEGRELADRNLTAMKNLHARFPGVKIVHFLNAAYYTKPDAKPADVTARMESAIAPGDEVGLHIHGWKRLFEASGVTFKSSPTFWGTSILPNECFFDCGHEVPISLYTAAELRKVVRFSLDTLADHGFGGMKSFRCGGWMAKESVREAVAAEGLRFEQSAVPASFLTAKLDKTPIHDELSRLWAGTTQTSQPFRMDTPAGPLVEVPDNGALADYVTADQMVATYEANKAEYLRGGRRRNVVVSFGFHQETAAKFLPELEAALERMTDRAANDGVPLESVTSEAIAIAP
jgi:hypothetical protein